jgi:hypothetical protein
MSAINILYIEDDIKRDARIKKFQDIAEKEHSITFQNFSEINNIEKKDIRGDVDGIFSFNISKDIDAIICDIEIWDKPIEDNDRLLVSLGYDFIQQMISNGFGSKVYFILTNCSRSLYADIKGHISNAMIEFDCKDDVLTSEKTIKKYIERIKRVLNSRKEMQKEQKGEREITFDYFINYINNKSNYPFSLRINELHKVSDPESMGLFIKKKCDELIDQFKQIEIKKQYLTTEFVIPSHPLAPLRTLCASLGYGSEIRSIPQHITDKDITSFVLKLIIRRFVIYLTLHFFKKEENKILQKTCSYLGQSKNVRLFDNILMFSYPKAPYLYFTSNEKKYWDSFK